MVKLLAVISPAKTLDFESDPPVDTSTEFKFSEEAQTLIDVLKTKSVADIKKRMKLSDALAELNVDRYQSWHPVMTQTNSKQALFAFKGDVYTGLSAETLTKAQINAAQHHLRILSGLYGLLKPLDRIQPYRLEMGTKLDTDQGKNLYAFWGDKITDYLNHEIKTEGAQALINLASNEYFKAVKAANVSVPVITPTFLDEKNGDYKIISFFAKKARGLMVRYLLDNDVQSLEDLKGFDYAGYQYSQDESDELNWVFKRAESAVQ